MLLDLLTACVFPLERKVQKAEALPVLLCVMSPESSTVPALNAVSAQPIVVPALNEMATHIKEQQGPKVSVNVRITKPHLATEGSPER